MEDAGYCAVCAEEVHWVAYGPCGHRDVCATCIARLRFVCHDRRCCICKSLSPHIFVTKALGSFTRVINNFSILPPDAKDGKVGSYWFHEAIQAYFDDFDEYKIIKAMCRLSCSFCDKADTEGRRTSKRKGKFKSIEQLKDHLSRQHELLFCCLCLEHKKVFICEQKLYTQMQLRRHIKAGDSEVDGDENERCGFSGHPLCEFCQTPFYGENELYFHMSTEHFTCHICQRQLPTNHVYYQDYNHLENHFRQDHFLCEDDSCLEKKFVVFSSEADRKRHNASEHGGNMSRSKRNAALQLPTCFHYQEREENDPHVRVHLSGRGVSDRQLPSAVPARADRANSDSLRDVSSIMRGVPGHQRTSETRSSSDIVPSSEQVHSNALDFRSVLMSNTAFPPLPRTSKRRRRKSKKNSGETSANNSANVGSTTNGSLAIPAAYHSATNGSLAIPATNHSATNGSLPIPAANRSTSSSSSSSQSMGSSLNPTSDGTVSSSSANIRRSVVPSSNGAGSSSSVQNPVGPSACGEPVPKAKRDIANKSLVEAIHAALEFDKDKFSIFKIISKEYREGVIDAKEYLAHVHQFGLAHLIVDLAKLCPDSQKQKELIEVHQTCVGGSTKESGQSGERSKGSSSKGSKKGKEKCEDTGSSGKLKAMPENIVNLVKELKLDKPCKEPSPSISNGIGSSSLEGTTATGTKKKTKKSKFLKARLGESSSSSSVSDLNCSDLASDPIMSGPNQDSILASVRGVWRNGGGRRLVTLSQATPMTR